MAESVVVADNVSLIANNIQSKVGATLLGGKAMAADTAKESGPVDTVLKELTILQSAVVAKLGDVWDTLKAQLDFVKEQDRRFREQLKPGQKPIPPTPKGLAGAVNTTDEGGFLQTLKNVVPATLLTLGGLRLFFSKVFKGALWGLLGAMAGSALVKKMSLEGGAAEDAIMTTLPTVAALMAMFNVKKALLLALPVVAALGMKSMVDWLTGDKLASDVSGFDWASVAITGPAAVALAAAFGAKFTMAGGLALGTVMTIGMPVLIAASLAIALAAGAGFIASSIGKIENTMLEHLDESTDLSQKEFERRLNEHRSHFIAQISPGIAKMFGIDLTMGQELVLASAAAKKKSKLEGEKGKFNMQEVDKITKSIDKTTKMDDKTLRIQLDDEDKAEELLQFLYNMKIVVQSQKLGKENSKRLWLDLMAMDQNIQMTAKDMFKEKDDAGEAGFLSGESYLKSISEGGHKDMGDSMESWVNFQNKVRPIQDNIKALESDPRFMDLQKIGTAVEMEPEDAKYWKKQKNEIEREKKRLAQKYNDWVWMYSGRGPDKAAGVDVQKMMAMYSTEEQNKMMIDSVNQSKLDMKNKHKPLKVGMISENMAPVIIDGSKNNQQNNSSTNLFESNNYSGNGSVDGVRLRHALIDQRTYSGMGS